MYFILTLVLNELVEEAGFPCAGTANHQKLKQEVWRQSRGGRDQCNTNVRAESPETILRFPLNPTELPLSCIQQPQISRLITKPCTLSVKPPSCIILI